jgi:hypothetical protein
MKKFFVSLSAIINLTALAQDHGHLNVGAVGTNQNDQLAFEHAEIFETRSDYVKTLTYANAGTYAGYHQGNITLTAVAATEAHLGPFTNSPALGAFLFAQLVSVDGPAGGEFAFWEAGATSPTFSLACGATGTNTWQLSQNDGLPGTDPYGHFHGRRFTATKPGVYVVGFRGWDYSTNGTNGGAIHTPSEILKIYFQAGDHIRSIATQTNKVLITFGARAGFTWQLQDANELDSPKWQDIGDPIAGDDYFHAVTEAFLPGSNRVYRVKGTSVVP